MDHLDSVFSALGAEPLCRRVAASLPEDVAVVFDVVDPEVKLWALHNCGSGLLVRRQWTGPVDCRVRCTAADLSALIGGRLDGYRAFVEGRIQIEGDVGLLLRLRSALPELRWQAVS